MVNENTIHEIAFHLEDGEPITHLENAYGVIAHMTGRKATQKEAEIVAFYLYRQGQESEKPLRSRLAIAEAALREIEKHEVDMGGYSFSRAPSNGDEEREAIHEIKEIARRALQDMEKVK
jgi:hypothetical protein